MYLLDTGTIIYNPKGDRNVQRALREHIQDPMKISIITSVGNGIGYPFSHRSGARDVSRSKGV